MATLHIEHPISDLETWLGAFNRFEDACTKAGVRSSRVHQPVDGTPTARILTEVSPAA